MIMTIRCQHLKTALAIRCTYTLESFLYLLSSPFPRKPPPGSQSVHHIHNKPARATIARMSHSAVSQCHIYPRCPAKKHVSRQTRSKPKLFSGQRRSFGSMHQRPNSIRPRNNKKKKILSRRKQREERRLEDVGLIVGQPNLTHTRLLFSLSLALSINMTKKKNQTDRS